MNQNPTAALPGATLSPAAPDSPAVAPVPVPATSVLAQLGRDTVFLLASLPVALVSFTVLVTGLSLAAGLLITVIGIPVAVATLAAASALATGERWRLERRGSPLIPRRPPRPRRRDRGLRGMLALLTERDRWAEVLHGISLLALALVTWSVAVTWWAGTLGGLTYWFWSQWLPTSTPDDANVTLVELLNLPITESQLNLLFGILFAVTLVPVLRGCANLHVRWAQMLLTVTSRRSLTLQVEDLTARRVAAASAEAQSLRRFERDLHDGPQQRLVRLGMDLSVAERRLDRDPAAARELLGQARIQAAEALAELRALSRGIAPPILADRGLEAALAAIAARSASPTTLDVDLGAGVRPTAAIENAAYFVVCEALTNTAKHAAATAISVRIHATTTPSGTRVLRVEVEDDGVGGADLAKGHGLAGLSDRVAGLDGTLTVHSPAGGPTRLRAELPC